MYDTLTLDELYSLHSGVCAGIRHVSSLLLDGETPRMSVFSDEWNLLSAEQGELWETAEAILAEIHRRELESLGTRLLRELRNRRGIDA